VRGQEDAVIPGSIFAYIWRYSRTQQLILVFGTLLYLPMLYAFFDLPKAIINGALQPGPSVFPRMVFGRPFEQTEYLVLLCLALLGLMLATAGLRYVLSVRKGVLGEIMLRRLRYDLFLRSCASRCRISGGSARAGGDHGHRRGRAARTPMGVAVANPVQGGTLATAMTFLFVRDWILRLAAIALFPLQAGSSYQAAAPHERESRRRLANVRLFAGHISGSISGVREIRSDTSLFERAHLRAAVPLSPRRRLYMLGNGIIFSTASSRSSALPVLSHR
jgi:putative ABC transport system ATP-binding protein